MSATEFNPVEVEGYTVQLLSYTEGGGDAFLFHPPAGRLVPRGADRSGRGDAIGTDNDVVAAIVTYHDGTQLVSQYAPYELTVNGELQPGGSEA